MATGVIPRRSPEERELRKKQGELAELQAKLAERELEVATLQGELQAFEKHYVTTVGARFAELDELRGQVAEAYARFNPLDALAREEATRAWTQANASARQTAGFRDSPGETSFRPTENLRRLYREVAKSIHPDLATDEDERLRRTRLMAEANRAYRQGAEARLEAILDEWNSSPAAVKGTGVAAELIRVIRAIAQVEDRLDQIDLEMNRLRDSDLFQLMLRADQAQAQGRDLLDEMAASLDRQIQETMGQLLRLRTREPKS